MQYCLPIFHFDKNIAPIFTNYSPHRRTSSLSPQVPIVLEHLVDFQLMRAQRWPPHSLMSMLYIWYNLNIKHFLRMLLISNSRVNLLFIKCGKTKVRTRKLWSKFWLILDMGAALIGSCDMGRNSLCPAIWLPPFGPSQALGLSNQASGPAS